MRQVYPRGGGPFVGRTGRHTGGKQRALSTLGLIALALSVVLSGCGSSAQDTAQRNKARLDGELRAARTNLSAPDSLLRPILQEENATVASTAHGSDPSYTKAAATYTRLYNQVVAVEHMPPDQARAQASSDLKQLDSAIQDVQQQGFVEAAQYQQRLQQAQQQFDSAQTTRDYFVVATTAEDQLAAAQKISPVYKQLQALTAQVAAQNQELGIDASQSQPQPLQCALGASDSFWSDDPDSSITVAPQPSQQTQQQTPTYAFQQWPAQDLALFRAASTAQQYDALASLMTAQSNQLAAESTELQPYVVQRLLKTFQADTQAYQQAGGTDTSYQQQATQDAQALAKAKTASDYTTLAKTLTAQTQALALPLAKAQAQHDFAALQQLVAQGQATMTLNPADNKQYPDAYEYADQATGIGDAQQRLASAKTADDYQAVDAEIQMFSVNLQAMLKNLSDTTAADQPHATDLSLMQHFGVSGYHTLVVSLREQEARVYENGKLVKAFKVTTGNPDLPSPPGLHCVFGKISHTEFKSPEPKGSKYYYDPTPINYGLLYSDYGYYIHDAWWRSWFGQYSNLPHYDPISFNNGSHGCVNFSLTDMTWLYSWAQVGTPVLVY